MPANGNLQPPKKSCQSRIWHRRPAARPSGRACENILAEAFVKPGQVAIMNFHFTTTKAHVTRCGGDVIELVAKKGLEPQSDDPFKGDFDLDLLRSTIEQYGPEKWHLCV